MQNTLAPTSEVALRAQEKLTASTARLLQLLSFVPDDKLAWSPSETSKSAIRLITHCSRSDGFFASVIPGTMAEPVPTVEEFFGHLHAADANVRSREEAIALLQQSTTTLHEVLGSISEEALSVAGPSPVGVHPASFWIDIAIEHRATHTGQLEYLQTIWGDLDNHFG